ncbi:hypothetical protein ACN38_g868 [Penicillium nordicum]|uniref:Uncharacterized protein n=1 Tax=Penicillium nordicum TaxID=229535 RepID=A0A0M8PGE2_9EURO|nr:hypothetical protein ACN38_g868 [Penicillium nordicum]
MNSRILCLFFFFFFFFPWRFVFFFFFFFFPLEISPIPSLARHPCRSLGQNRSHCSPKWHRLSLLSWVANHSHSAKSKNKK